MGSSAPTWDDGSPQPPSAPPSGARYTRLRLLGRGGMAEVHLVRDEHLGRDVACKVLTGNLAESRRARFLSEARLSAGLDHPNVAPVHDAGIDEEGRPWFTMKWIDGRTLAERIDAGDTGSVHDRVGLFLRVCDGVAYAHSHGVLHTDLKPSNVLVGRFGEVFVADWGIARRLQNAPTQAGEVVGTPAWMSPEQAGGGALDVRSDVYSLGAVLSALLCGRAPVGGEGMKALLAAQLGAVKYPRAVDPTVPAELDAVVRRAMAHELDDRYPSVAALQQDLRAWIEGAPMSVVPETLAVRGRRFARRHAVPLVVAGVGVAAALALGAASFAWDLDRTRRANEALTRARDRATTAEALADERLADTLVVLASLDGRRGDAGSAAARLREARDRRLRHGLPTRRVDLEAAMSAQQEPIPVARWAVPSTEGLEGALSADGASVVLAQGARAVVLDAATGAVTTSWAAAAETTWFVGFAGSTPWALEAGGALHLPGAEVALPAPPVRSAVACPGALFVAHDAGVHRVDLATGGVVALDTALRDVTAVDRACRLLAGNTVSPLTVDGVGQVVDAASGAVVAEFGKTTDSTMSPDGQELAGMYDGGVQRWPLRAAMPDAVAIPTRSTGAPFFAADGTLVASEEDGLAHWGPDRTLALAGRVAALADDGAALVVGPDRVEVVRAPARLSDVDLPTVSAAVSPDGALLASGGWSPEVVVRDALTGRVVRTLPVGTAARAVTWTDDGSGLVVATRGAGVAEWDVVGVVARWRSGRPVRAVGTGVTGGERVSVGYDGELVRATLTGDVLAESQLPGDPWAMKVAAPGVLLVSDHDPTEPAWRLLDPAGATLRASAHRGGAFGAAVSADHFAVGTTTGVLLVDDAGERLLPTRADAVSTAFSTDGQWLAAGAHDGSLHLWAVDDPTESWSLALRSAIVVTAVAFGPGPRGADVVYAFDRTDRLHRFDLGARDELLGPWPAPGEGFTDPWRAAAHGDFALAARLAGDDVPACVRARWAGARGAELDAACPALSPTSKVLLGG